MIDPRIYKPLIVVAILILWEFLSIWLFRRKLNSTFKKIKIDNKKISRFEYSTDLLLQKYKLVPLKNLKLIKLYLESTDLNSNSISQMFDSFHKLIITVTISGVTVATTISVALLAFFKDNKSLQEDQITLIEGIGKNLSNFSTSLNLVLSLLIVALIIFVISTIHSYGVETKNKLKIKHLRYIDEALKED